MRYVTIYNKEENKYYIDGVDLEMGDTILKLDSSAEHQIQEKGSLVGVFNKNKGYADFKQIKVLYENEPQLYRTGMTHFIQSLNNVGDLPVLLKTP